MTPRIDNIAKILENIHSDAHNTQGHRAYVLNMPLPTFNNCVQWCKERALVQSLPSKKDKRVSLLTLTKDGDLVRAALQRLHL